MLLGLFCPRHYNTSDESPHLYKQSLLYVNACKETVAYKSSSGIVSH